MTNAEIDRCGKLVLAEGPSEWEIDLTKPEGRMEAHLRWENGLVGYHPVYKTTADFMRDLRGVLLALKRMTNEVEHHQESVYSSSNWAAHDYETTQMIRELMNGRKVVKVEALDRIVNRRIAFPEDRGSGG